jgi:PAS domain-containing protein
MPQPDAGPGRQRRRSSRFRLLDRIRLVRELEAGERAPAGQRDLLTTIVNSLPDPVVLSDARNNLMLANDRADQLFSTAPGDSEGRRRAVEMNNLLFSSFLTQAVISVAQAKPRELNLVDPDDGSDLLFEVLPVPMPQASPDGGHLSILRNITDLKRAVTELELQFQRSRIAEERVREEWERLNATLENVGDPILVTDERSNIILMNREGERLFDVPPGLAAGVEAASGDPGERHQVHQRHERSAAPPGAAAGGEGGAARPGHRHRVPGGGGQQQDPELAGGAVGGGERDPRPDAGRGERAARPRAEGAERTAGGPDPAGHAGAGGAESAAGMAEPGAGEGVPPEERVPGEHEPRAPDPHQRGARLHLADAEEIYGELTSKQKNALDKINTASQHLLDLINDILDLSKIEAGKMPVYLEEVRLRQVLGELAEAVEPLVREKDLAFDLEVDEGIPPCSPIAPSSSRSC